MAKVVRKTDKSKSEAKRLLIYRCKYCGAILKSDLVGKYCPTKNCQWQFGID
jgi:hypothetical protein